MKPTVNRIENKDCQALSQSPGLRSRVKTILYVYVENVCFFANFQVYLPLFGVAVRAQQ